MEKRNIKFRFRIRNFDDNITTHIYTLEQLMKGSIGYPDHIISQDQFTNLLDKNGKEIYEGDILDCTDGFGNKVHEIKWLESGFNLSSIAVQEFKMEIIGNKFENPELIK